MAASALVLQTLLSGFAAIAWMRARPADAPLFTLRLIPRLARLRRTRAQWIAFVAVLLVARLQGALTPAVELLAALEMVLFFCLPTGYPAAVKRQRRHARAVAHRI